MADLTWSIEKIVDCKGNDITSGGWVTVTPTNGVGDTHASISVEPSTMYNDCETATITISTGTGEKKYVTINRCNPQCDCNAIEFNPLSEEQIGIIGENGGTVPVATYTMKFGCNDAYMGIVNTKSGCDYNITNGTVYAIIGKNPSTTSEREFEYYVTYNGERCNGDDGKTTYKGNFEQDKSVDPCENEDCNSVSISPQEKWVDYTGETVTVTINASDCWEVREEHDSFGGMIESVTFNKDMTESYIKISKNNTTSEDPREGHVKYTFVNTVDGRVCDDSSNALITISQYVNPNPPVSCDDCGIIDLNSLTAYTLEASYPASAGGSKMIGKFNIDSDCDSAKFWFAANPGTPSDIINTNKANQIFASVSRGVVTVLANYAPNGGSGGIINDNDSTNKRSQPILCGVLPDRTRPCLTIPIEQKGKSVTPTVNCKIDYSSIVFKCVDDTQTIVFNVKKSSSSSSCQQLTLVYSIEGTEYSGELYVSKSMYEGIPIEVQLEPNDYTIYCYNKDDETNSYRANIHVDSCQQPNIVTARLVLRADNNSYIYIIDNLSVYFKSDDNDIKKINLRKDKWYGYIPDEHAATNISLGCMEQCSSEDGYCITLQTEMFPYIYQDVEINLDELNINSQGILGYDLFVQEYCRDFSACGCSESAGCPRRQVKRQTDSIATPGVNWYEGHTMTTPYSYMTFTSDITSPRTMYKHLNNNYDGDKYRCRINFQLTGLNEEYFHTIDDPETTGYDTIILLNMYAQER